VYVENKVRELVKDLEQPIYVMTGTLYKDSLEKLPSSDESHKVPTGYWKIIATQSNPKDVKTIQTVAFIFPQNTPRSARAANYIHTIDEVEKQSGLDFLSALDDAVEVAVEASVNSEWVSGHFK
jgi:endonuclease G